MKNLKRWFEERYLDGDKMEDGHSILSSQECFEAIKDALAEKEKEIVEIVENHKFQIDVFEYLEKVKAWKGGYDTPFDDGYAQAKHDIINLIKNNEQRN